MRHRLSKSERRRFRKKLRQRDAKRELNEIFFGPRERKPRPKPLLAIASLFPVVSS